VKTLCHGSDKLYATTNESFLVVECAGCKLVRLFPRPTPEQLRSYYPDNYWFDGGADTADRLADAWRRLVLRDHVRFVLRALEAAGGEGANSWMSVVVAGFCCGSLDCPKPGWLVSTIRLTPPPWPGA